MKATAMVILLVASLALAPVVGIAAAEPEQPVVKSLTICKGEGQCTKVLTTSTGEDICVGWGCP